MLDVFPTVWLILMSNSANKCASKAYFIPHFGKPLSILSSFLSGRKHSLFSSSSFSW